MEYNLSRYQDEILLPKSSVLKEIIDILDYIANNLEEKPFYSGRAEINFMGKINNEKFELKANKNTGFIEKIKIGTNGYIMAFDKVNDKFTIGNIAEKPSSLPFYNAIKENSI